MNPEKINQSKIAISKGILNVLERYVPAKAYSDHLEDIVFLLTDALLQGKLYISFHKSVDSHIELKAHGWPKEHYQALLDSKWIEGESSPMKLEGKQLSWRRWYCEMNDVIQELLDRATSTSNIKHLSPNKNLVGYLNKEQQSAVDAIHNCKVILLSGGPGSGKTNTIIQMILAKLNVDSSLKIGLSAPTGKATRRLQETLQQNAESLNTDCKDKLTTIPCRTLHSWLEARPNGFGKNKTSPLSIDLLVVDEMSMVDLTLIKGLLDALPKTTQLILVGDPNQLPPINSGAIWEELQKESIRMQFGNCAIHLHKVYRNRGSIASLAKSINKEGLENFLTTLEQLKKSSNVTVNISTQNKLPTKVIQVLEKHKVSLKQLVDLLKNEISHTLILSSTTQISSTERTQNLFAFLEKLMVLSPKKNGFWGVNHIHQTLIGKDLERGVMKWPEGTPIICTKNQPELGLSNGDIGIIIGEDKKRRLLFKVLLEKQTFVYHFLHPARLENVEPAYALTIHKSQGSEASKVILLWPTSFKNYSKSNTLTQDQRDFDQKLIYTAITRAKEDLDLQLFQE